MHDGGDLKSSDAAIPMTATVSRPFFLDLHGLSQSAARIALVQVSCALKSLRTNPSCCSVFPMAPRFEIMVVLHSGAMHVHVK